MTDEKIKEVVEAWNNGIEQLASFRSEMRADIEMAWGDQWYFVDSVRKTTRPYLSINIINGRIRRRSGFIRQNMPEARVVSLSSYGDEFCDVMQQALKYIYSEKDNYINRMSAIDDALAAGIGWLYVYMDYNDDIINGDVKILKVSPFDIVFDPYISSPDFSDMRYLVHRSYMHKKDLIEMYPQYKDDIEILNGESESEFENEVARTYISKEDMINVFDYWYTKHEYEEWYVNLTTGEYGKYDDSLLPMEGEIKLVRKKKPKVYLRRCISDRIVVYDKISPFHESRFPYIPIVCYANFTHPNWEHRIKGIARTLKDLQLEKNKRRSSITRNVLNKFLRGYMKLRDETADLQAYLNSDMEVLEVDSLDSIKEIDPPKIPEALMILEKEIDNDLNVVDTNLEMLDNATTYQAVGALQLKLRENLIGDQEIYDNVNYAMHKVSSYIVEMVNTLWTVEKFKKIVGYNMPYREELKALEEQASQVNQILSQSLSGEDQSAVLRQGDEIMKQVSILQTKIERFWHDFERMRRELQFVVKFGEGVEETPTYKLAYLNTFTSLKHQGQNVPDEVYIEFLDIPKRIKDKWLQSIQNQYQAQQQIMQMQQQHELDIERLRGQIKMVIQEMANEGKLEFEKLKQKDVYEYDITKRNIEVGNANTKND